MLNWILAIIAVALWTTAYGWYSAPSIVAAWNRWRLRRTSRQPNG